MPLKAKFELDQRSLNQTLKRLNLADEKVKKVVLNEFNATGLKIQSDAKQSAPVNFGLLRNRIESKVVDSLTVEVSVKQFYAAFIEFGTKRKVRIDPRLTSIAAQYKGLKRGGMAEFHKALDLWLQRKGIDRKHWYSIKLSILRNGIKAQPFFFPAYFKNTSNINSRLKKRIEGANL